MLNRVLHDALRAFALEAARLLQEDHEAGAELGFEVAEEPGSGPILYRYRPLTAHFIAERWPRLSALPSLEPAVRALGAGALPYLRRRGVGGPDAAPALRVMLERLYEESTSFGFPEERFERVYGEVERMLYEHTTRTTVVAPLQGLACEPERVELGDGLMLAAGESIDAPAEAVWPHRLDARDAGEPKVLCVLERELPSDAPPPVTEARICFRSVLTGLRLLGPGALGFGPLCWARADDGPWQTAPLGFSGSARGEPFLFERGQREDLRELLDALGRSRHGGAVSWALARFEMGCERALATEALSDYLLGLAALLDGPDGTGRASLSLRLAALCAEECDRRAVQRRFELAFALERLAISGGDGEAYIERIGSESPAKIVLDVEEHLRALLRDVLCGLLDPDLKSVADDILLDHRESFETRAHDRRGPDGRPTEAAPRRAGLEPDPVATEAVPHEPERDPAEADTGELRGIEQEGSDAIDGVTPSADWEVDEESAAQSAPV